MATLEQLKNLEVPEGYQNRANFLVKKGNTLAKDRNEESHAHNCYKKALRLLEEGEVRFPTYDFQVPISLLGFTIMMDDVRKNQTLETPEVLQTDEKEKNKKISIAV